MKSCENRQRQLCEASQHHNTQSCRTHSLHTRSYVNTYTAVIMADKSMKKSRRRNEEEDVPAPGWSVLSSKMKSTLFAPSKAHWQCTHKSRCCAGQSEHVSIGRKCWGVHICDVRMGVMLDSYHQIFHRVCECVYAASSMSHVCTSHTISILRH